MKKKVEKKIWNKKNKKWFIDTVAEWKEKYSLQDWVIELLFEEKDESLDEKGWATSAQVNSDNVYKKATITFFPSVFLTNNATDKDSYKNQDSILDIKHELCHLMTGKIADLAKDRYATKKQIIEEIETLTQKIATIT